MASPRSDFAFDVVTVPVAAGRHRVDGEDAVAGGDEGTDQQTAVDLDPDDDIVRIRSALTDKLMHQAHALDAIGDARLAEHLTVLVEDTDVVVVLCPVDPDEDHLASLLLDDTS